ncbi:hypothetical protein [Burkholderia sp. LMG 13014]|uniref:hypothetical protein n=1 Tax=Burkholderia sp. LMG 13014 TaxID=2709306 RepID=UPI0019656321|nr:hypothetical protein [Burkholderia sp. LMG 13014]
MKKLCALTLVFAAHAAHAGAIDAHAATPLPLVGEKPVSIESARAEDQKFHLYKLSGETAKSWAPEGVWSDEQGVHARFKSVKQIDVPDIVYAVGNDGSAVPVGIELLPVGVWTLETHASRVVFRKGSQEVTAVAIELK